MKDPEFVAAWKLDQEARLDQRYGQLFRQLNLPPEQLAVLRSLLAERESAVREVWASAREQGLNPRDPEARDQLNKLASELRAEVDETIRAQLGSRVLTALEEFNATSAQRAVVGDLSIRLGYLGQPLNEAQAAQLTRILVETGTAAGGSALITDDTLVRAAGVLTPAQVDALRQLQAEQQARQIIQAKTRAAREAAAARAGSAQN